MDDIIGADAEEIYLYDSNLSKGVVSRKMLSQYKKAINYANETVK